MKRLVLTLVAALVCILGTNAQPVNLTPRAKSMTAPTGQLTLPKGFRVACGTLPDSIVSEATRFVSDINAATGLGAIATSETSALITIGIDDSCQEEGYTLAITTDGINVKARTTAGFYYAFQTIKKILPANVMARVYKANTTYSLPCVTITDEPRFGYRGFMLDVSRHFFSVDELKRMIDIMAAYKMNRFHWHLTDDQGWRAEIKRYPRLTTVGATAPNCRITDMKKGTYWTNAPYGPYYYTQNDMREIVQYCKERHIEVLPEVDMPGHFVAAMAAYPQYSCTPQNPPTVWTNGGVSTNVLNVANPEAIAFVKNIIDELAPIFPYPYFHIGGDECPTTQWESNASCQELYKRLGLKNYRELQSHFINEISKYLASKGKRTVMWNESITAGGADLEKVKEYNPIIMSWFPCQAGAAKAAKLGLQAIVTEYHGSTDGLNGGYYINRKQSADPGEPDGAGYGDDTVEGCYIYVPVPSDVTSEMRKYYTGVQATFWTEWVSNPEYLEYLALPRLMAVAEAGWTPEEDKNFDDFCARMAQDTVMLNYGHYQYGRHIFAAKAAKVMPEANKWYSIATMASDVRKDSRFELLSATSPLLTTYADKGARANRLWANKPAAKGDANYDNQLWRFEESASAPGCYALVCKAMPEGSLNPAPTTTDNSGRWTYDTTTKHYDFMLGDRGYGDTANGNHYYTIRAKSLKGWFMNAAMAGQGFAVNLWTSATDGRAGLWELIPAK